MSNGQKNLNKNDKSQTGWLNKVAGVREESSEDNDASDSDQSSPSEGKSASLRSGYNWPEDAVKGALKITETTVYGVVINEIYGRDAKGNYPPETTKILSGYIKGNTRWYDNLPPLQLLQAFEDIEEYKKIEVPKEESGVRTLDRFKAVASELDSRFRKMIPLIRKEGRDRLANIPGIKIDRIIAAAERGEKGDVQAIVEVLGLIALAFTRFLKRTEFGTASVRSALFRSEKYFPLAVLFLMPDDPQATMNEFALSSQRFFEREKEFLVMQIYFYGQNSLSNSWIPISREEKYRWVDQSETR